jgi:hypothetical protein
LARSRLGLSSAEQAARNDDRWLAGGGVLGVRKSRNHSSSRGGAGGVIGRGALARVAVGRTDSAGEVRNATPLGGERGAGTGGQLPAGKAAGMGRIGHTRAARRRTARRRTAGRRTATSRRAARRILPAGRRERGPSSRAVRSAPSRSRRRTGVGLVLDRRLHRRHICRLRDRIAPRGAGPRRVRPDAAPLSARTTGARTRQGAGIFLLRARDTAPGDVAKRMNRWQQPGTAGSRGPPGSRRGRRTRQCARRVRRAPGRGGRWGCRWRWGRFGPVRMHEPFCVRGRDLRLLAAGGLFPRTGNVRTGRVSAGNVPAGKISAGKVWHRRGRAGG